jgi:peptidoglycan hydrolase CwlO-like protein
LLAGFEMHTMKTKITTLVVVAFAIVSLLAESADSSPKPDKTSAAMLREVQTELKKTQAELQQALARIGALEARVSSLQHEVKSVGQPRLVPLESK